LTFRNCVGQELRRVAKLRSNHRFVAAIGYLAFYHEREALCRIFAFVAKWQRLTNNGVTSEGTPGQAQTTSFDERNVIAYGGDVARILDLRH
jgi:hypothetical protein